MTAAPSIALLGLGPLGSPIAQRLLDAEIPLVLWNRTPSKANKLVANGAQVAESPASAAAQVVLTVLPDLPQVEQVTFGADGLVAGWRHAKVSNPILVIHGTTDPDTTAEFADRMRAEGVDVIDAPVSGGVAGAEAGTLSIMVGGDSDAVSTVEPIFRVYGNVVTHFGPSGAGALAKSCNQVVVAGTIAAIAEALVLAEAAGLDKAAVIEILEGGLAASEVLRQKKPKWLADIYEPGGSARNQLKDLRFIEKTADSRGLQLGVTRQVRTLFESMVEHGEGGLDHAGVIKAVGRRRVDI